MDLFYYKLQVDHLKSVTINKSNDLYLAFIFFYKYFTTFSRVFSVFDVICEGSDSFWKDYLNRLLVYNLIGILQTYAIVIHCFFLSL